MNEMIQKIVTTLYDKKAQDIVALDVSGMTVITDCMVIASGRSALQITSDAYGIPGHYVEDGNDVIAVYEKMQEVIDYVRSGNGPALVEVESYRWFGHSTADAGAYRTKEEVDAWKAKDPLKKYRTFLTENKIATDEELDMIEKEVAQEIEDAVKFAQDSPEPELSVAFEDVWVD